MKFTILGATGFIGSNFKSFLEQKGIEIFAPDKFYKFNKQENLGHVVYCIGLTADFRYKPHQAVHAHVIKLLEVLETAQFESFLYLSSTRIYSGASEGKETSNLIVNPLLLSDLYNLSKLMGESACLALNNNKVKVVRLANIIGKDFGSNNFIFSILKDAIDNKKLNLQSSLNASKNYILVQDAIHLMFEIISKGKERIYNLGSDNSTKNSDLITEMKKWIDFEISFSDGNENLIFPHIDTSRIKNEFGYQCHNVLDNINILIQQYKNK